MTRLRWARAVSAAALVVLVVLAGCGGKGEVLVPVEGQVTVDGKPLATGTVVLHPDKGKGNTTMHEPRGEVEAGGKYKVVTGTKTAGAPPGWYSIGPKPRTPCLRS